MNFSTASGLGRTVALALATATVSLTASFTVAPAAKSQSVTLNGAGATFPTPLYNRYFDEFKKVSGIQVNYQSIGSGGGVRQFTAGTVDFGASDDFMSAEEIARVPENRRPVLQIPTAGGAVAIAYNVPGIQSGQLRLSRAVYPAIFTGEITRWNDPRIVAGNRGLNLPDAPIRVAVRADSSGTSAIFSSALAAVSPSFRGRVGASKTPRWPQGFLRGRGNEGVAATLKQTENSIGYIEASYAEQNKIDVAQLENKARRFVLPTIPESARALATAKFAENFDLDASDPSDGYPIVGGTWILLSGEHRGPKAAALRRMMEWILTDGQNINQTLQYVRLPAEVAARARTAVQNHFRQ